MPDSHPDPRALLEAVYRDLNARRLHAVLDRMPRDIE